MEAESLLLVLTFDEKIRQSLAPWPEEQLLNPGAGAEKLSAGRDTQEMVSNSKAWAAKQTLSIGFIGENSYIIAFY